jgi:FMN phosphatase YigB (HAD superfamily)
LRRDREGARRMGMRFIWMMPRGGPEQPVEHAVTELPELMRILQ